MENYERLPGEAHPRMCESCSDAPATLFCTECDSALCEPCSVMIHRPKGNRNHTRQPLNQDHPVNPPPDPLCATHNLPRKLVHQATKELLCVECAFERGLAKSDCMPIEAAVQTRRDELTVARQRLLEKATAAQQRERGLDARQAETEACYGEAAAAVLEGAAALHARVDEQSRAVVARLEAEKGNRCAALGEEKQRVSSARTAWEQCAGEIQALLGSVMNNSSLLDSAARMLAVLANAQPHDNAMDQPTLVDKPVHAPVPIALDLSIAFDLVGRGSCTAQGTGYSTLSLQGKTAAGENLPPSAFLLHGVLRGTEEERTIPLSAFPRVPGDPDTIQCAIKGEGMELARADVFLTPAMGVLPPQGEREAYHVAGPFEFRDESKRYIYAIAGPISNIFDLQQRQWTDEVLTLNHKRQYCAAVAFQHFIYVVGGYQALRLVERLDLHDETRRWIDVASMNHDHLVVAAAATDNTIYALGHNTPIAVVEQYDVATNRWTAGPTLPQAVACPAAVSIGNIVYSIGSGNNRSDSDRVFRLDPREDRWFEIPHMGAKRGSLAAVATRDAIFAIGGPTNTVEKYDTRAQRWAPAASMRIPRFYFDAVLTDDNTIYALGGGGQSNTVEMYDIAHDRWCDAPPMPVGRCGLATVAM